MSITADQWLIVDLGLKVLAGIGALIAFGIGLHQYRKGQNWQKLQILISLIDSFEADRRIEAACAMLDWDERSVTIDDEHLIKFRNEMLVSALRVPPMDIVSPKTSEISGQETAFTEDEGIIRDSFDAFFDYFEKLYAFQKSNLLKFTDYIYFYYWFELLRDVGKYKNNPEVEKAIKEFITAYQFVGIQELLKQYIRHPEPLFIMEKKPQASLGQV